MAQATGLIQFSGHQHLRLRLVLSILSGKSVRIDKIRSDDKNPGLRGPQLYHQLAYRLHISPDFEISLLRLLEKVTNGTIIEISVTGTALLLKPGIISGGPLTHDCPLSRSIGYFLEPVVMLAPFAKKPLQLTLRGITTDEHDLSVDLYRTVTLPHLQLFGISDGLELRIKRRGAPPAGGGEIQFLCPVVKQVKTLNFVEPGKIKRIRGIAHAVRVNPQFSNRMIEASRSILNRYIPDIYLYSDVYKGEESGKSPGYALSLLAESTTSALHCSEAISQPGVAPEDIALRATRALLAEINTGGCVDRQHQTLVLLMMVLGSEDVGRCRMGEPTPRTIQFLRDVRSFFGTSFKIVAADPLDKECAHLLYSCYGTGYINANRSVA
ncbi:18S rRNA biogenesis protein [Mycena vitilis]|nr:18S rRNA biogenesis protein [Mycena vitilis]